MGAGRFYSKDGYGWSSAPIAFDRAVHQSTVRAPSTRLYHGDIVEMAPSQDAQQNNDLVIIVSDTGDEALLDIQHGRLVHLQTAWVPPISPFAKRRIGTIWENPALIAQVQLACEAIDAERRPPLSIAANAAAAILLGVCGFGVAQWLIFGGVGPFLSLLGGFIFSMLHALQLRRRNHYLVSRPWALRMTPRVSALAGVGVVPLCFLSGMDLSQAAILSIAALFLSGVIWLLSVDVVAWQVGGYQRDT